MLSLVTTVAAVIVEDEAEAIPVDTILVESPARLLSCCCCGADEGTLIVILNAVGGEVVTTAAAGADEIEDDEMGDDSRELILISLELLLSSTDCFVGGRIGLMVSLGTVGVTEHSARMCNGLLPSAEQS